MKDHDKKKDLIESEDPAAIEEGTEPEEIAKFTFSDNSESEETELTMEKIFSKKYEDMTEEEKASIDNLKKEMARGLSNLAASITPSLTAFSESINKSMGAMMQNVGKVVSDMMPHLQALQAFMTENEDILSDLEAWEKKARDNGVEPDDLLPYEFIEWVRHFQEMEEKSRPYFMVPSTPLTKLAKQIVNNPTRIQSTRKGRIQRKDLQLTDSSILIYSGNGQQLTIELANIKNLFSGKIRNGAKVLTFLCEKMNGQNYAETTFFSLQELVDNGIYKNKNTAYKGLKTNLDTLAAVSIEGVIVKYEGKKEKEVRHRKAHLVAERDISWNICSVTFPPIMREGMKFITILPRWSYTLSDTAFMLLDYIYTLARQRSIKVKNDGFFTLSLEAVRAHLGLPSIEEAGKDPGKRIKNIIEGALEEIEIARDQADSISSNEDHNIKSLLITPIFDYGTDSVKEYLKGYLKVELDEEAQEYMNKRALEHEKKLLKRAKEGEKQRKAALAAPQKEPVKSKK